MAGRAGADERDAPGPAVNESTRGASERREAALIRLTIDPSPRRLRQTLAAIDRRLAGLEEPTLRRIRLVLSEVIGRSWQQGAPTEHPIAMQIEVNNESIRIDLSGPGLALPQPDSGVPDEGRPPFPGWVLGDLVDEWGTERRGGEPGIWLRFARERHAAEGQ
jgi:hypothetical protein